jgi:hypothetical protein
MEFTYIGIDPSLASTAVYIKTPAGEFYYNFINKEKLTKWHKVLSYVDYVYTEIKESEVYSEGEILKNLQYDIIAKKIVEAILTHCKPEESFIAMEGFSYASSNTSSLIDLVALSTLIRYHILQYNFVDLIIKAPSSLKADTCLLTYGPGEKKKPSRNDEGIAGGKFKKREMLKAVFDNDKIQCRVKDSLLYHKQELLKAANIPKPIDDIIDSILLVYTEMLKPNQ